MMWMLLVGTEAYMGMGWGSSWWVGGTGVALTLEAMGT